MSKADDVYAEMDDSTKQRMRYVLRATGGTAGQVLAAALDEPIVGQAVELDEGEVFAALIGLTADARKRVAARLLSEIHGLDPDAPTVPGSVVMGESAPQQVDGQAPEG